MSPGTAFLFFVMGLGMLIATGGRHLPHSLAFFQRLLCGACGAVTVAVSGLRLLGYFIGNNFHLDLLWFHDFSASPARMSPATSLAFLLVGASLLLAVTKPPVSRLLQVLALLGGLVAWVGLSRYLYGGQPLGPFAAMAAP
jgi:hypothetical protein